jgi:spore coat polysaccharide biosynthesis predicted glycosyltransferase SpsG
MKKIKKYFQLSDTISGLNYFLRNIIATISSFIGGYLSGYGLASQQTIIITLGFLVLAPAFWLSFANIYKRSLAVFPKNAILITMGMVVGQILVQLTQGSISPILNLSLIIMGLILIFKNSNIENHEG